MERFQKTNNFFFFKIFPTSLVTAAFLYSYLKEVKMDWPTFASFVNAIGSSVLRRNSVRIEINPIKRKNLK